MITTQPGAIQPGATPSEATQSGATQFGATPFGATSTAAEVLAGVDLTGRRMIVTGASSGLGAETARALAGAGAEVTLAVRDLEAGHRVAASIPGTTHVEHLDLADRSTIAAFAKSWKGPLHALIANAGIMALPTLQRTAEGLEMQFAVNHLGHFALATALHDALARSGDARLVVVSSVGHLNGDVDFTDPNFLHRPYDPWLAYSQSKTANILFALEAARRWAPDNITANALNPGRIWETGLSRHTDARATAPASFAPNSTDSGVSIKNPSQGAATTTLLAGSPLLAGITGRYFEDCNEAHPQVPGLRRGLAPHAHNPTSAARLWSLSHTLLQTP